MPWRRIGSGWRGGRRRRRFDHRVLDLLDVIRAGDPASIVRHGLAEAGASGVAVVELARRLNLPLERGRPCVVAHGGLVLADGLVVAVRHLAVVEEQVLATVRALQDADPLRRPVPFARLQESLCAKAAASLVRLAIERLVGRGRLRGGVRGLDAGRAGSEPLARITHLMRTVEQTFRKAALTPPDAQELLPRHPANGPSTGERRRSGSYLRSGAEAGDRVSPNGRGDGGSAARGSTRRTCSRRCGGRISARRGRSCPRHRSEVCGAAAGAPRHAGRYPTAWRPPHLAAGRHRGLKCCRQAKRLSVRRMAELGLDEAGAVANFSHSDPAGLTVPTPCGRARQAVRISGEGCGSVEVIGVWWPSWSSKPWAREQRAVGSIPIRHRASPCGR